MILYVFCDEIYTNTHLKCHLNRILKVPFRIFFGYVKISNIFWGMHKIPNIFLGYPLRPDIFSGTEQMLGLEPMCKEKLSTQGSPCH